MQNEQNQKAAIAARSVVLRKWLWILFWLIIPSSIASIMTNDTIINWFPSLFLPGQILSALCFAAYGCILLKLRSEDPHYQTAGICTLVAGAAAILLFAVTIGAETLSWTLVISLPAMVLGIVSEYYEYMAHSAVLSGVDNVLSDKWNQLWKWYIGTYGSILGSVVLVLIIPILGALLMIAASIVAIVVSIMKLVYLYRTAKLFREYEA